MWKVWIFAETTDDADVTYGALGRRLTQTPYNRGFAAIRVFRRQKKSGAVAPHSKISVLSVRSVVTLGPGAVSFLQADLFQ
jgi:hypothetical protein